jgi:hypothetical protein
MKAGRTWGVLRPFVEGRLCNALPEGGSVKLPIRQDGRAGRREPVAFAEEAGSGQAAAEPAELRAEPRSFHCFPAKKAS